MRKHSEYENILNGIKVLKRKSYRHYILDSEVSNHLIFISPNPNDYSCGTDRDRNNFLVYYYWDRANFNNCDISDREYFTPFLDPVLFQDFFETLPDDAKLEFAFHLNGFK